ncbi:MAG: ATP synthase A1 subunit C [Methanobacteriaceae archaeon]
MADILGSIFANSVSLILVVAVTVALITVLLSVKQFSGYAPFAYSNARVMARRGRLLEKKQIIEIIDAKKLEDMYNLVSDVPEYKKYLDKFSFEKAMDMDLAETHQILAKISATKFKEFFDVILTKWDIQNIKTLLAAKEMAVDTEEIKEKIIPFGKLPEDILIRLLDAENIEEIATTLKSTVYYEPITEAISLYKEKKTFLPLEASLDKYHYEKWLESVSEISNDDGKVLNTLIKTKIDLLNLKIILRARSDGLEFKDIKEYIFASGDQLYEWKLNELMNTEKIVDFVDRLEGTDYADILKGALPEYDKTGSISALESALDKYSMELGIILAKKRPSTIGPMIGFLSQKEIETKNLKLIYQAKLEGFSPEEIRRMLIGGWT